MGDVEACGIVAGFYHRLHVPALPRLRPLTSYVARWNTGLEAMATDAPMPRRLVEQAVSLAASFLTDEASVGTMIHGDLHYENVLAGDRAEWLGSWSVRGARRLGRDLTEREWLRNGRFRGPEPTAR